MVEMTIELKSIVGSHALHALSIHRRKCRYVNESPLHYYPYYYTENLCQITCRIQSALKLCNCVPFFYYSGKFCSYDSFNFKCIFAVSRFGKPMQMKNRALRPNYIVCRKRIGINRIVNAYRCATTKYM